MDSDVVDSDVVAAAVEPTGSGAPICVGVPNLGSRATFDTYVDQIFATRRLSNGGPLVSRLEERIASRLGVRHCLAVANGTLGLQIAVRALGLSGEVILPSFTFVATAHALALEGVTPVFADIDEDSHQVDPDSVEAAITSRTTGIVGVHLWGRPAPVERLAGIAGAHGLNLLFDAAHAFNTSVGGRMVGSFGQAEVFSFHATKFFTTVEGGAVVTNDDEVAERVRRLRMFGMRDPEDVDCIGTNGKLSELHAAMGLANLDVLDDVVATNRAIFDAYDKALAGLPNVRVLPLPPGEVTNAQYVVIEVDDGRPGLRDHVLAVLGGHGVLARRYFWPGCHRMAPYRLDPDGVPWSLPRTQALCERVLVLPTGTAMTPQRAREISAIVASATRDDRGMRVPGPVCGGAVRAPSR